MEQDDPADWSIDRVILEVCNTSVPSWAVDTDLKPIKNPQTVAQALRDNDIDGDNLLALEDKDIRSDLGVTSFGQRRGLNNVIAHLRSLSPKYQARVATMGATALATPYWTQNSILSHIQSPSLNGVGIFPSIESMKGEGSNMAHDNTLSPSLTHGALHRKRLRDDVGSDQHAPVGLNSTGLDQIRPTPNNPDTIMQENETASVSTARDVDNTTSNVSLKSQKTPKRAILQPAADPRMNEDENDQISGPIYQSLQSMQSRTLNDNSMTEPPAKRPKTAIIVDEINKQLSSHEANSQVKPRRKHRRADMIPSQGRSESVNFSSTSVIDDAREFIWSSQRPVYGLSKRAARHISLSPYHMNKAREALRPQRASDTLQQGLFNIGITHSIQALPNVPNIEFTAKELETLRRYPVEEGDAALPVYGDSDEEDRWTSSSESSPPPVTPTGKVMLGRADVDNIIDDTFEQFKADWRERSLAKTQGRAHRKWMAAAKNQFLHHGMLNDCKYWRDKTRDRVRTLRNGIHATPWHRPEDVKQQCLAIKLSLHQLEEWNLYVSTLESDNEPYLPPQAEISRSRRHRSHVAMDNGDEELDSDSLASFLADEDEGDAARPSASMVNEDGSTWDPKFAKVVPPVNRENTPSSSPKSLAPESKPHSIQGAREGQVQSHDVSSKTNQATYRDDIVLLDISDEEVTPLSQKYSASTAKQAVVESAKRNPIRIPHLTDSEDNDSDLDRSPRRPRTVYRQIGKTQDKAIDLTGSSPQLRAHSPMSVDSINSIRTPKLEQVDPFVSKSISKQTHSGKTTLQHRSSGSSQQSQSIIFDVKRVMNMDWDDIAPFEETDAIDNRLALAKAVYELSTGYARSTLDYLTSVRHDDDLKEILANGLEAEREFEEEITDVEKKNQFNAQRLTHLLISYSTGYSVDESFELSDKQADDAFALLSTSLRDFRNLLENLLRNYIRHTELPSDLHNTSEHDTSDVTDTENEQQLIDRNHASPAKVRKRRVVQSKAVLDHQRQDQFRVAQQERKRALLLEQQSQLGVDPSQLAVPINVDEPIVYLNPKLAAKAKPHQVEGIRFMWRELIENSRHEGCLLAHTMGLGKTMQVIALLASIAQCNASDDHEIRKHIPPHLQKLRVLVLCPVAIIENWYEELLEWLPDPFMLGMIVKLDAKGRQPDDIIRDWFNDGGVLIMNYERYRSFVLASDLGFTGGQKQSLQDRCDYLTQGPSIVVADEAHRLKNAKSKLNEAVNAISTKSRIALTGSPLNNHLEEYHTMIDWISAGYLGSIVQFRARYAEPINQGLYSESTSWERKESMKRLHMLKKTIAPKINRADITAISKDLPAKTEFFLTIAMTKEQAQAYKVYVQSLRDVAIGGVDKQSNTHLWSWLSVLSLLLSHPSCFIEKLQERKARRVESTVQAQRVDSDDEGDESTALTISADNVDVSQQSELANAMDKVRDIFQEARVMLRMDDPSLSTKSLLIQKILEEASKIGEKTLIFSKSIPTLNYYETMVNGMGLAYKRIDGQRASAPGNRQKAVADFNESDEYKVFLISTKAGGLGLNIQSASRVIISDFDFNPAWEEQAIGRAYRIGQTKPVFVYRFLMGGTFEEVVHNKAVFKTQLFYRVVDEKNVISQAEKKPSEFLFDPRDVPKKNFDSCLSKDPEVLDRVLQKVDCVRDIILTETFFQDVNEELNEQELKEANELLEMERLERDNPAEYMKKMQEKHRLQAQAAQQAMQRYSPMMVPNLPNAGSLNHFVNMTVPPLTNGRFYTGIPNPPAFGTQPRMPHPGTGFGDEFMAAVEPLGRSIRALFQTKDDQSGSMPHRPAHLDLRDLNPRLLNTYRVNTRSPYFRLNEQSSAAGNSSNTNFINAGPHTFNPSTNQNNTQTPPVLNHNQEDTFDFHSCEDNTNDEKNKAAQGCRPQ